MATVPHQKIRSLGVGSVLYRVTITGEYVLFVSVASNLQYSEDTRDLENLYARRSGGLQIGEGCLDTAGYTMADAFFNAFVYGYCSGKFVDICRGFSEQTGLNGVKLPVDWFSFGVQNREDLHTFFSGLHGIRPDTPNWTPLERYDVQGIADVDATMKFPNGNSIPAYKLTVFYTNGLFDFYTVSYLHRVGWVLSACAYPEIHSWGKTFSSPVEAKQWLLKIHPYHTFVTFSTYNPPSILLGDSAIPILPEYELDAKTLRGAVYAD